MNPNEPLHSIQQLSTKLNIPKPTLRYWEKEFEGILQPLRTNGGQRRYAPEHVAVIKEIQNLKREGLSLVEIKRKLGEELMPEDRGQRPANGGTEGIGHLAERVAEVVKIEVLKYFERGKE